MPSLVQQRDTAIRECREIVQQAKSAGRDLTAAEVTDVNTRMDSINALNARIENAKAGEDIVTRLGQLDGQQHPDTESGGLQFLDLSPRGVKSMAAAAAHAMVGHEGGRKAILPAGETFLSVPTVPETPVSLGIVQNGFLATLGVTKIAAGATARYLRQTTRTNNAAAVPAGTQKPTSIYGLTPRDVVLKVYAHLSEPQDRFMLEDANALAEFIASELVYGLFQAVESDCIDGASGGPGIVGVLATSGIRTIAFDTDLLTTTRTALAQAESMGYAQNPVFVLSPDDLAAVDLAKASTSGVFVLDGAPQQRPTPTLWGVPVATANGLPADTGLLVDRPALSLYSDKQGVRVDWGTPNDAWSKNQIVARCEGRFDLGVLRPEAVAKIATATP